MSYNLFLKGNLIYMAKKADKGILKGQVVGVGVGLTAAAAALAGAYFLYGSKNAAKNRKVVKSWALKAKADVLEVMEKAESMTKEEFEKVVATVGTGYVAAKQMTQGDFSAFQKEMMTHWKDLTKKLSPKPKKAVKKIAKKSVVKK